MGLAEPALTGQEPQDVGAALADVQRLVVSAFAHLPWARYSMLRLEAGADRGPARTWLASLAEGIPTAAARDDERATAVAFTAAGLLALGTPASVLAAFPRAFRQGMASEHRARLLGDVGDSAPERWTWGGPDRVPHVLLVHFARTAAQLEEEAGTSAEGAAGVGFGIEHVIDTMLLPASLEHFGFTDGISQPAMAGTEWAARAGAPRWEVVAPGEFVLGLVDQLGLVAESPHAGGADWGRHGSYLVLRQLEQHVERFRAHVADAAAVRGLDPDDVAAKLVGRHRDGASLATGAPGHDGGLNDFGYGQDQLGLGCPLGAHVRRANPRDSTRAPSEGAREEALRSANRHRILRRGRPYGPLDDAREGGEPRGLLFLALNADIERQFEFVQHTWLGNPVFAGLAGELDPITVEQPAQGGSFSVPQRPVRDQLHGLPSFTTTVGGAYFFLPGIAGLRLLCDEHLFAAPR